MPYSTHYRIDQIYNDITLIEWLESWEGLLLATDILTTCAEVIFESSDNFSQFKIKKFLELSTDWNNYHLVLKMASAKVVKTSVANIINKSLSQDSNLLNDLFQSRYVRYSWVPTLSLIILYFCQCKTSMVMQVVNWASLGD